MVTRCTSLSTALLLVGSLLMLGAAGCAPYPPPPPAAVYPAPPPPPPAPVTVKRFVRSETGQLYYVDSQGLGYTIVREVPAPSAGGGLYYYIEDDTRPYVLDESQRLYFRDPSGRIYYLEEVRPGRVIEYRGVYQGVVPPTVVTPMPAIPFESCASQYEKCMDGCRGISPRQSYDRPNCISNCEVIRSQCSGR